MIPDYVVQRKNRAEFGEESYEFPGKSGLQGNSEISDHWLRDSERLSSFKSKNGTPAKDLADLIKLYNEQKSQLTPPQNSLERRLASIKDKMMSSMPPGESFVHRHVETNSSSNDVATQRVSLFKLNTPLTQKEDVTRISSCTVNKNEPVDLQATRLDEEGDQSKARCKSFNNYSDQKIPKLKTLSPLELND